MMPIRVWFVRTALDAIGGAERMIAKVMRGLPNQRFDVTAVWLYEAGAHGEELRQQGIRTYANLGTSRMDPRLPMHLLRLAYHEKPHIVFTTENALACFWSGMLKRLALCERLVIGFRVTKLDRLSYRIAVRSAAPVADVLVTLTDTHRQYWQTQTGQPEGRFWVIPNGVDTEHFVPVPNKRFHRQQLGLPTDVTIVGLVAYFKPVKNLPLFVEVAHRVASVLPQTHFVLVGDGTERSLIEQKIHEKGLVNHFTLPGVVNDPAPWYQAMDILLLTSHSEALPGTVLEANSCAIPAVATDVGGIRDVILYGKTGFYVPAGNADMLAEKVLMLCQDVSQREQMGLAAREHIVQNFSEDAMVRRYAELFEQLAQRQK